MTSEDDGVVRAFGVDGMPANKLPAMAPAATPTSPTCGRVNFLHPAGDGTRAF
jgi:hypothetical protein